MVKPQIKTPETTRMTARRLDRAMTEQSLVHTQKAEQIDRFSPLVAKLYTDLGDTESTVRHLQKLNSLANTGTAVIVTREEPVRLPAAPVRAPGMMTSTDGASAAIGAGVGALGGNAIGNAQDQRKIGRAHV